MLHVFFSLQTLTACLSWRAQTEVADRGSDASSTAGVAQITSSMTAGWSGFQKKIREVNNKIKLAKQITKQITWLFFLLSFRLHFFSNYDNHKTSRFPSRPIQFDGKQPVYKPMLDELTLEHMTQDCSVLRNQLLRLKTLLQVRPTFADHLRNAHI